MPLKLERGVVESFKASRCDRVDDPKKQLDQAFTQKVIFFIRDEKYICDKTFHRNISYYSFLKFLVSSVKFPHRLDTGKLTGISNSGENFNSKSVIVHIGSFSSTGHYIAYGPTGAGWARFNDSSVEAASEQEVRNVQASMLFYARN